MALSGRYAPTVTNSSLPSTSVPPSSQIRLPGVAGWLLGLSPLLLLIGVFTAFSTGSRGYFERAATQTTVGTVMILVGIAFLLTGFVLVGIRAVAQQQLNFLLDAARASDQEPVE